MLSFPEQGNASANKQDNCTEHEQLKELLQSTMPVGYCIRWKLLAHHIFRTNLLASGRFINKAYITSN